MKLLAIDAPRIVPRFLRANGPPLNLETPSPHTRSSWGESPIIAVNEQSVVVSGHIKLDSKIPLNAKAAEKEPSQQTTLPPTNSSCAVETLLTVLNEVLVEMCDPERDDLVRSILIGEAAQNDHFTDILHRVRHAIDRSTSMRAGFECGRVQSNPDEMIRIL